MTIIHDKINPMTKKRLYFTCILNVKFLPAVSSTDVTRLIVNPNTPPLARVNKDDIFGVVTGLLISQNASNSSMISV